MWRVDMWVDKSRGGEGGGKKVEGDDDAEDERKKLGLPVQSKRCRKRGKGE